MQFLKDFWICKCIKLHANENVITNKVERHLLNSLCTSNVMHIMYLDSYCHHYTDNT